MMDVNNITNEQLTRLQRQLDKQREYHKTYYEKNKEKVKEYHRTYNKKQYAIKKQLLEMGLLK